MKNSKELMVAAKIVPKLRLGVKTEKGVIPTGPHRVKLIEDKITTGKDVSGKQIEIVQYTVEENGDQKIYTVPVKNKEGQLHYMVQHLSEIVPGQEVILEMKKAGIKNYVSVLPVNNSKSIEVDDQDVDYGDEESITLD